MNAGIRICLTAITTRVNLTGRSTVVPDPNQRRHVSIVIYSQQEDSETRV